MTSFSRKVLLASALMALLAAPVPPSISLAAPKETPKAKALVPDSEIIIARVDGKAITKEDLETATNNLLPMVAYHSSVSDEKYREIRQEALDKLINNEAIYKAARDAKDDSVKTKEIDDMVADLKKRLPKGDSMDAVLKRSNMTLAELKEDFKRDIVVTRFSKKKSDEFKEKAASSVTEAFMKDYYQKNLRKFKEPEQFHVRSILIKADPSGGQRVWNESLKKAQEVAKLAKSGSDFVKLAEKYSEDPYAKKGGDMGWAHQGSLVPEIDNAAGKMKAGETSDPIMTIYGYHVIKLEGKKPSVQKKFEELNREKLKGELEKKEYKRLWDAWLKGIRGSSKIEILKPVL